MFRMLRLLKHLDFSTFSKRSPAGPDYDFLQVEFANLLVLNKVDLVTPRQADQLEALLNKLNPKAKVGAVIPRHASGLSLPAGNSPDPALSSDSVYPIRPTLR